MFQSNTRALLHPAVKILFTEIATGSRSIRIFA